MKIKNARQSGFTLVEIMIVVAIIGLLAAIAIPNFVKARTESQKQACIANLKQIEGAKASWAMEQQKNNSDTPDAADIFGANAYIRDTPECPSGGDPYIDGVGAVDTKPVCSLAAEGHEY